MVFDKNESVFPSDFHREVWWWAVGLVPPSVSLIDAVKSKCSDDILKGCYQWYDYFNELCEDMYSHEVEYAPASARQYRDILENITADGTIQGDAIVWSNDDWQRYVNRLNKSKAYITSGITMSNCLNALERAGIRCEYKNDTVVFSNAKHPKIFHAMNVMEHSPNIRKTPARHHFAHCEYRQLFKSYSANYDELLRCVSDESVYIAHSIHDFAKSLKIQRYIHFDTIKYKHKNVRVLDFTICGNEYPTLRVNIGTCANPNTDISNDDYYRQLLAADIGIQRIFVKNLEKCSIQNHSHQTVIIDGKKEQVCPSSRLKINLFKDDLEAVMYFIAARKSSIDNL